VVKYSSVSDEDIAPIFRVAEMIPEALHILPKDLEI